MKSLIGVKWYPRDNSYSTCFDDPTYGNTFGMHHKLLAGTSRYASVEVEIISEPFDMKVYSEHLKKCVIHKFVIVSHKSRKYIVMFRYEWLDNSNLSYSELYEYIK